MSVDLVNERYAGDDGGEKCMRRKTYELCIDVWIRETGRTQKGSIDMLALFILQPQKVLDLYLKSPINHQLQLKFPTATHSSCH